MGELQPARPVRLPIMEHKQIFASGLLSTADAIITLVTHPSGVLGSDISDDVEIPIFVLESRNAANLL